MKARLGIDVRPTASRHGPQSRARWRTARYRRRSPTSACCCRRRTSIVQGGTPPATVNCRVRSTRPPMLQLTGQPRWLRRSAGGVAHEGPCATLLHCGDPPADVDLREGERTHVSRRQLLRSACTSFPAVVAERIALAAVGFLPPWRAGLLRRAAALRRSRSPGQRRPASGEILPPEYVTSARSCLDRDMEGAFMSAEPSEHM